MKKLDTHKWMTLQIDEDEDKANKAKRFHSIDFPLANFMFVCFYSEFERFRIKNIRKMKEMKNKSVERMVESCT